MAKLDLFSQKRKKTTGRKNDRIAAQIKECFSIALIRREFPILPNHETESKLPIHITITYVDLSPDCRNATIFFVPLGGLQKEEALRFFELQQRYFKNLIAKKMEIRYIPDILFKLDNSFEHSQKIEELIKKG